MVLYRTVFEILTPKVWNVFIESPDMASDIWLGLGFLPLRLQERKPTAAIS